MFLRRSVKSLALLLSILHIAECDSHVVNKRVGNDVDLKCQTPEGTSLITWYKDSVQLNEHLELRIRGKVLRMKNVQLMDQGYYTCKGIDGFGTLSTKNFSLFVYGNDVSTFPENPVLETITRKPIVVPRFAVNPPGKRELMHNVYTSPKLRCRVLPNSEADIDWYKDGRLIDYFRSDITKEGYSITFNSLRTIDEGKYMCRVYNEHGSVNFTYTLKVTDTNLPTATVIVPQNTSVMYGSSASLQCKVRSYSIPTIMWLKQVPEEQDGVHHIILQEKIYTLIKNETMMVETEEGAYLNKLVLANVKMEDAGIYVCLGLNQRGGSDFREALLTVIPPPVMTTTTLYPAATDNSWEYIFGSPSATLAVLIAIPVVIILIITIAIIYGLNKKKKNTGVRRRRPSNMTSDHEVGVPLNMNANNGCYSGQHSGGGGSTSSHNKVPISSGEPRYAIDKQYKTPSYRSATPQQYSQYFQSDGSYRSSLQHQPAMKPQQQNSYMVDIPDSDSHFSSVSHTRPQYMSSNRNPYDDRDIHSDPPTSRVGGHHCPPPPPGSYYSGQW